LVCQVILSPFEKNVEDLKMNGFLYPKKTKLLVVNINIYKKL